MPLVWVPPSPFPHPRCLRASFRCRTHASCSAQRQGRYGTREMQCICGPARNAAGSQRCVTPVGRARVARSAGGRHPRTFSSHPSQFLLFDKSFFPPPFVTCRRTPPAKKLHRPGRSHLILVAGTVADIMLAVVCVQRVARQPGRRPGRLAVCLRSQTCGLGRRAGQAGAGRVGRQRSATGQVIRLFHLFSFFFSRSLGKMFSHLLPLARLRLLTLPCRACRIAFRSCVAK